MNNKRTYGIEIECISQKNHGEVAEAINQAFQIAEIDHNAVVMGYSHSTNASNLNRWEIKSDSSIFCNSQFPVPARLRRNGYNNGIEIVSPVLKGKKGLEALEIVCNAISDFTTPTASCGLHVHHGIKRNEKKNLYHLIKNWYEAENHFMAILSRSRRHNGYCQRWQTANNLNPYNDFIRWEQAPDSCFDSWIREQMGSNRYWTLNFQGYILRGAIEFRCHQGTTEYKKIKNWVILTQAFTDKSLKNELNFTITNFEEYMNQYKVSESTNELIHPDSQKKSFPKIGTKNRMILELIKESNWTKEQIQAKVAEEMDYCKMSHINAKISHFRSLKRGFGWIIEKNSITGKIEFLGILDDGQIESQENSDIAEAVNWAIERKNHFQNAA